MFGVAADDPSDDADDVADPTTLPTTLSNFDQTPSRRQQRMKSEAADGTFCF